MNATQPITELLDRTALASTRIEAIKNTEAALPRYAAEARAKDAELAAVIERVLAAESALSNAREELARANLARQAAGATVQAVEASRDRTLHQHRDPALAALLRDLRLAVSTAMGVGCSPSIQERIATLRTAIAEVEGTAAEALGVSELDARIAVLRGKVGLTR